MSDGLFLFLFVPVHADACVTLKVESENAKMSTVTGGVSCAGSGGGGVKRPKPDWSPVHFVVSTDYSVSASDETHLRVMIKSVMTSQSASAEIERGMPIITTVNTPH